MASQTWARLGYSIVFVCGKVHYTGVLMQPQNYIILQFLFIDFSWPASKQKEKYVTFAFNTDDNLDIWSNVGCDRSQQGGLYLHGFEPAYWPTIKPQILTVPMFQSCTIGWALWATHVLWKSLVSILKHWLHLTLSTWTVLLASHGWPLSLV